MYEDLMEDPEVAAIIDKYDNSNANDVPLDEFGKPLEIKEEEQNNEEDNPKDEEENPGGTTDNKGVKKNEDTVIDPSQFEDYQEDVPEVDYSPNTEFAKTLDFDKMPDDFNKYVLANVEPVKIVNDEGKEFRAYTVDDIPKDFKFASEQEAMKVSTELARLEGQGTRLKEEYDLKIKEHDDALAANESVEEQLDGLSDSIANGEFPKLELDDKGKLNEDSKINSLANDILEYQSDYNKDKGSARAISFDTALNRFKRDNPDRFKELEDSLSKEDEERENYAKRTSRSSQRTSKTPNVGKYDNLSREEFDQLLNDPDFDVRKLMK